MRYSLETEIVAVEHEDQNHASTAPLYQSATFYQPGLNEMGEFDYTRSGNPTRSTLERHLAKVMGNAHAAFAVTSGMGALDVISRLIRPGDEVVAGDDLYGGSSRLLTYLKTKQGVTVHHVDTSKVSDVEKVLNKHTRIVLLESPTNPAFKICDIPAVSKAVKQSEASQNDVIVVVDNTMMTPLAANPFKLGADVWYESATKYLCGHHDVMAGAIAVQNEQLAKDIKFVINANGSGLAPFDCWLLLRGIKTLGVRFEKQQQNAIEVAEFLEKIGPKLTVPKFELKFPGYKGLPGYEVHERTTSGVGAVLSFRTHDIKISEKLVDSTKLFKISVSFGSVNSLISLPCKMSHASIDAKTRAERGFPEDIVRLCIGIENAQDLIDDLDSAFRKVGILS